MGSKLGSYAVIASRRRQRCAAQPELRSAARLAPWPIQLATGQDFLDILLAPGLDDRAVDVGALRVLRRENTANLNLADAALGLFGLYLPE